jgi:hypothetical protein
LAESDGDGMPDAYEVFYGFAVNDDSDAGDDDDADTMDNLAECIAGTNPTNAASFLQIVGADEGISNRVVLSWSSADRRRYDVLRSTNLLDTLSAVETNIPATPPTNVHTGLFDTAPAVFYGIGVRPPDW